MKKMYILINEDIKISKGKLAGQVGHAVSSYIFRITEKMRLGDETEYKEFSDYMNTIQKKILLKCPEEKLTELENVDGCYAIRDKGLTHLKPNTLTCVNIGLYSEDTVPEWIKELKLY